jgi:hypothetical protein
VALRAGLPADEAGLRRTRTIGFDSRNAAGGPAWTLTEKEDGRCRHDRSQRGPEEKGLLQRRTRSTVNFSLNYSATSSDLCRRSSAAFMAVAAEALSAGVIWTVTLSILPVKLLSPCL